MAGRGVVVVCGVRYVLVKRLERGGLVPDDDSSEQSALEWLFSSQDKALQHNLAGSAVVRRRLAFLDRAVGIAVETLGGLPFADEKKHSIRVLSVDGWSTLATAIRVALWGNLSESFALLRSALETSTILAAAVESKAYKTVVQEIGDRQRRLSFDEAVKLRGESKSRIRRLHGDLSNLGAHATGHRLALSSYQINGESFDRFGMALDPEGAADGLRYALDISLDLLASLETAHQQENRPFPGAAELDQLRTRFASLAEEEPPSEGAEGG